MSSRTLILTALTLSVAACAGCQPPGAPVPPPAPTQPPQMEPQKLMVQRGSVPAVGASAVAAMAHAPLGLRVEIYQLQVPFGTVSRNETFWKRVEEQTFDPTTYDLLYKNGVRVGLAPISEWESFRELIAEHPAVTTASDLVAAESKPVEIPMRKDVTGQVIFYYDGSNQLVGGGFDASENLITIAFQQAPRKPQTMRVVLCPVVRSKNKRLEYSPLNRELEIHYVEPQRLYDLNFRADVPAESFLVVAPSEEAKTSTSIGHNFLLTEAPAERLENVLLIVPRSIRIEQVATPSR